METSSPAVIEVAFVESLHAEALVQLALVGVPGVALLTRMVHCEVFPAPVLLSNSTNKSVIVPDAGQTTVYSVVDHAAEPGGERGKYSVDVASILSSVPKTITCLVAPKHGNAKDKQNKIMSNLIFFKEKIIGLTNFQDCKTKYLLQ